MRDVQVIKDKRNELRNEMAGFLEAKRQLFPVPTNFSDLGSYDRQLFSYITGAVNNLRNQINALEFVLNEDTELADLTVPYPMARQLGISKESVFEEIDKGFQF